MYRLATMTAEGVHWSFRRNCSVSPRQLGGMFAGLCALSLAVAGFFWRQGAWMVLPFSVVEVVALGVAFVLYARHATDGETISIRNGRVIVEQEDAGRLNRVEFASHAVRIEAQTGRDRLVGVCGRGLSLHVGRFLRPDQRMVLARELRQALGRV